MVHATQVLVCCRGGVSASGMSRSLGHLLRWSLVWRGVLWVALGLQAGKDIQVCCAVLEIFGLGYLSSCCAALGCGYIRALILTK